MEDGHVFKPEIFFDQLRKLLFRGSLSETRVSNLDAIFDYWEETCAKQDDRCLAYALAPPTTRRMRPSAPNRRVRARRGRPYGVPDSQPHQTFYGRGLVQLTHKSNYQAFSSLLGVDLVQEPGKPLELENAIPIMFIRMKRGLFTASKLSDDFNDRLEDRMHARRIINGLDRADKIAGYGKTFYAALSYTT